MKEGLVLISDYNNLIKSKMFADIERFSNRFLVQNENHLENYARKIVPDPLHQWSRQWEYPFVYNKLWEVLSNKEKVDFKILDAGSGITFFPYYIQTRFQNALLYCCDRDTELKIAFDEINKNALRPVDFSIASLHNLDYESNSMDAIYCISVLEHTEDYARVVDEFERVLKPGGTLLLTFDISLDGVGDINVADAERLLLILAERFTLSEATERLESAIYKSRSQLLTTRYANKLDATLLPPGPDKITLARIYLSSLFRKHRIILYPPNITVYCISLKKHII